MHMQCMRIDSGFGAAVKAARGKGVSQAKLAALINVAPSTIYRIERGEAPSERVEKALRRWCPTLPEIARNREAA